LEKGNYFDSVEKDCVFIQITALFTTILNNFEIKGKKIAIHTNIQK
jgi:hypothetical protein